MYGNCFFKQNRASMNDLFIDRIRQSSEYIYVSFTFYLKVCTEKISLHKLKKYEWKKFCHGNVTQFLD